MIAADASQALATVVVDELVRGGMTDACLAPGSRSTPLALALDAHPRVRLHVRIDERSASFLALGLAKASGRPAAVLCTSGTAAANLHPAVLEAHQARVPLVVLTADRPPELRDTGANQTVDQVKLYGGAVRWFADVAPAEARPGSVAYWRSLGARAAALAGGAPAGPVHLNLAFREPLVPAPDASGFPYPLDGRAEGRPWTVARRPGGAPADRDVAELAERVAAAEAGVVVGGDGPVDPAPVLSLAAVAGWPVLAEPSSGLRAGPHAVSAYHALLSAPGFADRRRPDLVLRIGRAGLSRALAGWLDASVPQVLIDRDGAWLDPERTLAQVVRADPALLCERLAEALPPRGRGDWLDGWQDAERRARGAIDALLDAHPAPSEPRAARDLADRLPAGSTLVVASSMPIRDLDWTMRPRSGLRILANRGASGIDGFVSTAIGVASATPGPTFALAGDLSLLHDQNGLLPTGPDRVDLVMVVVNNDGGGIFSLLPQAGLPDRSQRLFATPHGLDLSRLAGLYGCGHTELRRAAALPAALDAARRAGGVQLIEVRTDRSANAALHRRLLAEVARALS